MPQKGKVPLKKENETYYYIIFCKKILKYFMPYHFLGSRKDSLFNLFVSSSVVRKLRSQSFLPSIMQLVHPLFYNNYCAVWSRDNKTSFWWSGQDYISITSESLSVASRHEYTINNSPGNASMQVGLTDSQSYI